VTDGQQYASSVHYAKLPPKMVQDDINALKTVTASGNPLLTGVPSPS
jgi:hypothetical protein